MFENALLAKFDLDQFLWKPLAEDAVSGFPGRQRPLAGGERAQDTWNRYYMGDQALFFAVYVDIISPIYEAELIKAARSAWIWLRYHIPTIASRIMVDSNDEPTLVYQSEPAASVEKWANRTFLIDRQDTLDLDELRRHTGGQKIPSESGDQTWLHLVPGAADSNGVGTKFGLLFHTHHAPFDGSALKIIFNRYLSQLSIKLANASEQDKELLEWGREIDNLVPAAVNILLPTEPVPIPPSSIDKPSFAHPYYRSLGMVFQGIGESLHNPYGLKSRNVSSEWPITRRESVELSRAESDAVMKALKPTGAGEKYTLTHVVDAALIMTLLSDHPPGTGATSQFIHNLALADCRHRLKEPFSSRDGYPGYCLGAYPMKIPVSTFLSTDGKPLSLDKGTLAKSAKIVRELYAKHKEIPAPLSYVAQGAFIFTADIKQSIASNQILPNQGYSFSSDGPGEKYMNSVFRDGAGVKILSIEKFFISLNRTDPGPFFRVSSWHGNLDFSADFNLNSTSSEEVKKHLSTWKKFVLLVCDFSDGDY